MITIPELRLPFSFFFKLFYDLVKASQDFLHKIYLFMVFPGDKLSLVKSIGIAKQLLNLR